MVTALLAAQNILGAKHDVWAVNADDDYHEEGDVDLGNVFADLGELESTQPHVPPGPATD
jgi:hypothetical protein